MMTFALFAALLLGIALLFLIPSLRRQQGSQEVARNQQNILIAKDQLKALHSEQEDGLLSQEEFDKARADLEKNLSLDLHSDNEPQNSNIQGRWATWLVLVFVPVVTVGLYMYLGDLPSLDPENRQAAKMSSTENMPSVEEMISTLAEKLEKEPKNAEGWFMLGRSYMAQEQYAKAADAYANLYELVGDEPGAMMPYADALAMTQDGRLTGKPLELIDRTLEVAPAYPMAMWLKGMAWQEQNKPQEALEIWQDLLPLVENDEESLKQLQEMIAEAQQQSGIEATAVSASHVPQSMGKQDVLGTGDIQVQVVLDPGLKQGIDDTASVFIMAKAINGPRMPLAVSRHQVKDLPITVTLNDSMAMMPELKMSAYKQVSITARVSFSGNAIAQSGDLSGEVTLVKPGQSDPVSIQIDSTVP